jgi:ribulose kinase
MSSSEQHTPDSSASPESSHAEAPRDSDYDQAVMFNTLASMDSRLPPGQEDPETTAAMLSLAMQHGLAAYDRQQNKESAGHYPGHDQPSTGHDQPQSSTGALIDQIVKEHKKRNTGRDQPSTGHDQPQSSTGALIDQIVKEHKERNTGRDQPSTGHDQPQSSTGALIDQIVKEHKERNTGRDQPTKSIAQRRDDVARSRSQSRERDHSDLDNSR